MIVTQVIATRVIPLTHPFPLRSESGAKPALRLTPPKSPDHFVAALLLHWWCRCHSIARRLSESYKSRQAGLGELPQGRPFPDVCSIVKFSSQLPYRLRTPTLYWFSA